MQIPQSVLDRYNAVNAQAQQVAQTPFQPYTGQMVAPIDAEQTGAISGINASANLAQPYYTQAAGTLGQAQQSADPYFGSATNQLGQGAGLGTQLGGGSLSAILGANASAQPFQLAAGENFGGAYANAQPYQIAATGLGLAGGQAVDPYAIGPSQIGQFLSPYLQQVLGSTAGIINQQNQQQQAGQLGDAIRAGAFGGDRAGIAAANLEQQQNLANANIYSGIENQGFSNALAAAQQQQGLYLGAGQANRAALQEAAGQLAGIGQQGFQQGMGLGSAQQGLGAQLFGQGQATSEQLAALSQLLYGQGLSTSQQLAGLGQDVFGVGQATSQGQANIGTQAQQSALAGAQAQLAAGTVQQQTQQAQDTAQYNQFLQQQAYPFQVAQFLADIAEGTGALSGSTTTTTTPGGLFSDERLKEDIKPIGKTYDGQTIVSFRYKGEDTQRVGLIAQDVEKKHPEAVGESQGFKTVDYGKATEDAASKGHFRRGGLIPSNDNAVNDNEPGGLIPRKAYAYGGYPMLPGMWPADIQAILQAQSQMYAPYGGSQGLYGGAGQGLPRGGGSYVPNASLPVSHLAVASPPSGRVNQVQQMKDIADFASNKYVDQGVQKALGWLQGLTQQNTTPGGLDTSMGISPDQPIDPNMGINPDGAKRGGLIPRSHRDSGGSTDSDGLPPWLQYGALGAALNPHGMGLLSLLGRKSGGRTGYDDGGDIPYEDSQDQGDTGPKLNIPNDNPKAQLAVAQPGKAGLQPSPLSQIGSAAQGLGSLASAASGLGSLFGAGTAAAGASAAGGMGAALGDILPFLLALNKGGSVRKGYATDGSVDDTDNLDAPAGYDPNSGDPMSHALLGLLGGALLGNPTINAPTDLSSRLPGPKQTPITPSEQAQAQNATALAALAATGQPDALAGTAYGLGRPSPEDLASLRSQPSAPAAPPTPRTRTAGPSRGLAPASTNASLPQNLQVPDFQPTTSDAALHTPAPDIPNVGPVAGNPIPLVANQGSGLAPSAPTHGTGLGGALSSLGQGIEGAGTGILNWAHNNPNALMALLSGIGAAGAAQTKYPLIALTQGLGAAGQTYMQARQQQAQTAEAQAAASATNVAALNRLMPAPPGYGWQPGKGDPDKTATGPDGRPYHLELVAGMIGGAPTGPSQAAVQGTGGKRSPLAMDYSTNQAAIGPSSDAESFVRGQFKGFDPNDAPVANVARLSATNPEFKTLDTLAAAKAQDAIGDQNLTDATHRQYLQLAQAINGLSPQGFLGKGEDFDDRLHMANIYNTYAGMLGLPTDPSVTAALTNEQIIAKIKALTGVATAGQAGQHSAYIANELSGVLPGGVQQQDASNHILAQLLVANQRQRDFAKYYTNYVGQNGFSAGVDQAFQRDFNPIYDREQQKLQNAFPLMFHKAGTNPSAYELLQQDPRHIRSFEQGGNGVEGFGEGFSRYFQ